ncbi:MAG: SDR family oxidoreductase [Chloroflexota bacterium]|nr:SDR family oxidoreductase [Chloroflexota bacterium]
MGIGEGCARVFARAGAPVVVGARDAVRGEAVAKRISEEERGDCRFIPCDVTQPEQIKELIEETVRHFGRLDCLINNAGWHPPHYPIDDFSVEDFKNLLQLNLVSYFAACKYALPHLRKTKGSIINMSSLVGAMGQEWAATYVSTKGGITALSKALAVDEARNGVRVNAVLPGVIETPLLRSFIDSKPNPQAVQDALDSWQWTGRYGTMEEVGEACLFLASDGASFITGIELIISGGAELAYGAKLPKTGAVQL